MFLSCSCIKFLYLLGHFMISTTSLCFCCICRNGLYPQCIAKDVNSGSKAASWSSLPFLHGITHRRGQVLPPNTEFPPGMSSNHGMRELNSPQSRDLCTLCLSKSQAFLTDSQWHGREETLSNQALMLVFLFLRQAYSSSWIKSKQSWGSVKLNVLYYIVTTSCSSSITPWKGFRYLIQDSEISLLLQCSSPSCPQLQSLTFPKGT